MNCESHNVGNVAKNAVQYEALGEARKRELLQYLVEYLIEESELHGRALPPVAAEVVRDGLTSAAAEKLWLAFRSLVNVRPPWPAPALVARRHHHPGRGRHRERRQLRHDRMLGALALLHRQRHPHLRRRAIA